MSLLKGSVIDFATELIGSSFRVVENPQVSDFWFYLVYDAHSCHSQAKGSGCGCGVSWELKL